LNFSVSGESELAGSGRNDPIVGDRDMTDLCILLGNRILEKIGIEYPNVSLGFYSYSVHGDYPLRYVPNSRINQIFAPINFSRFHSVFDTNSKTKPYYRSVVEQWGAQSRRSGNQLAYRGYNWNLAENMLPYSQLKILGEELPWYHKQGVEVINVEATKAWSLNGAHDFLLAKLSWDVAQNWRVVLKDYCAKAFGEGGAMMEEYFLDLTRRQHAAGQESGSYYAFPLIYDQAWVAQERAKLESAEKMAEKADERTRIRYVAAGLEALALYLEYFEAAGKFEFALAQKAYDAMLSHWRETQTLNANLVAREVPEYLKRFIGAFVSGALKVSTAPYQIVQPLPDLLTTMIDPNDVGEKMNFYGPDLNDTLYFKTRTWSAPWDSQGLGAFRKGAVWYRVHFALPAKFQEKHCGLFLGGVEDQASVWLNGKEVGASQRRFSNPILFDLTSSLHATGDNVLVIRIRRISAANEIGLGGILRPSFIFSGPAVSSPSAPVEPQERVLPGAGGI
jgi:hypothetical protein